ncbi:MAG: hypothetical protein PVG20_06555 [Thioalkalispiraceae bacterium]
MPDNDDKDDDVISVAEEIARYLKGRQQVADTIDGIAEWWIIRQRIHEERERVEKAVEYLLNVGLIKKRVLPDGTVIYTAVH